MRLARWSVNGDRRDGFVIEDRVAEFPDRLRVIDVVSRGLDATIELGERLTARLPADAPALAEVRLRAPIDPPSVRDFVAFEEHVEGIARLMSGDQMVTPEWYEAPTFYFSNPHAIIGPDDPVVPPAATRRLDFELEVAAVIGGVPGSDGAHLSIAESSHHIFGYTIMNDWSARDLQAREMAVRLGPCKGKDFATTLGPWITTADEVIDRVDPEGFLDLAMRVTVNGVEIGGDTLANLGWPFEELVAYASRDSRVVPGDVLGSGTSGGGCLAELWGRGGTLPPLAEGDIVVLEVDRLGGIGNRIGPARVTPAIPSARPRPGRADAAARRERNSG